MKKHYESLQGDNGSIADRLNQVSKHCKEIKVLTSTPIMIAHPLNPKQQVPGAAMLLEVTFEKDENFFLYDQIMRPQKLKIAEA